MTGRQTSPEDRERRGAGEARPPETTDPLTAALAETLARQPGMAARLLGEHVDRGNGSCAACSTVTGRVAWPCTIVWHVLRATG